MLSSIQDLPKRLELFNKRDWEAGLRNLAAGTPELNVTSSRDPLHWAEFGLEVHAVWGFDLRAHELRVLLGEPLRTFTGEPSRFSDRRNRIKLFALMAPRLVNLALDAPSIERVISTITETVDRPQHPFDEFAEELRLMASGDYLLEWAQGGDLILGVLLDRSCAWSRSKEKGVFRPVKGFRETFLNAVGRVYDHYFYKDRVLKDAPSALFQCKEHNAFGLQRIFSDPLAFDPRESVPLDAFLWPWQRSIAYRDNADGSDEIFYRAIPTTSLVLDIRASTTAMDLSSNPAAFAQLIDGIVEGARSIIIRHGGFFDKETGDGIVAHFCHATSMTIADTKPQGGRSLSVPHVAVLAATEIVKDAQTRCREYQKYLIHGLDGLGPAVGIHTGNAVWLADGNQARAIGPPVVGAARLCSRADVSEILVSNLSFLECATSASADYISLFEKKRIDIKEYNEKVGLYGHALRVKDVI
jgi:class 3 adenylate cyclase